MHSDGGIDCVNKNVPPSTKSVERKWILSVQLYLQRREEVNALLILENEYTLDL